MAIEIERKFLVASDAWRSHSTAHHTLRQGYLNRDPARTVRVRVLDAQGFVTIKGKNRGAERLEFEYEVPLVDAQALLALCDGPLIEKVRHLVPHQGHVWEVDVFEGDNAGLIVAEIELQHSDEAFAHPDWLGDEVTHDARYFNSALAQQPYKSWAR